MTSNDSVKARHFSRNLASLRGLAATVVLVCHSLLILKIEGVDNAYMKPIDLHNSALCRNQAALALFNGSACVTLFFVLSGTVLAMSLDRGLALRWSSLPAYWIKRLFRLYPLLMAMAALGALLQIVLLSSGKSEILSFWGNAEYKSSLPELPRELALNMIGASSSLNSPAWSIKIEILVSMFFPLLFVMSRSRRLALPFLLLLIGLMFIAHSPRTTAYVNVFTASFFLGALVYRRGQPLADWYLGRSALVRYTLFALVLLVFLVTRRLVSPTTFVSPYAVFIEMFCAAFFVLVALYGHSRIMSSPPLVWLGEVSYSVYLVHVPVLFVVTHLAVHYGIIPATGNHWFATFLLAVTTLVITLPLASITHRLIEAPGQALGSRLGRRLSFSLKERPVSNPTTIEV
ncbi:MAG: acyltransferase [Methylacidiphilales bacterium]|nr:acyltransferase [Candidatus Methylacidiphilales bacterium]